MGFWQQLFFLLTQMYQLVGCSDVVCDGRRPSRLDVVMVCGAWWEERLGSLENDMKKKTKSKKYEQ